MLRGATATPAPQARGRARNGQAENEIPHGARQRDAHAAWFPQARLRAGELALWPGLVQQAEHDCWPHLRDRAHRLSGLKNYRVNCVLCL